VHLLSDSTFGRGEPTPGEVDIEVEHDDLGLPFLGGKALHGLLRDSWVEMKPHFPQLSVPGLRVLGREGDLGEGAILRVGNAQVAPRDRAWVEHAERRGTSPVAALDVLRALTDIRYQTSQDRRTGGPATGSLRASRVVRRELVLTATLGWLIEPEPADIRCLALAALGVRHAGLGRNRGRGHVRLSLDEDHAATCALARS
jgi:hypothetical protein